MFETDFYIIKEKRLKNRSRIDEDLSVYSKIFYLSSDNQIEQIKELMKTMSNINNRYLMVAMGAGYQSEMEIAKTYDFKQLFEYSSTWKDNYSTMEKESDD